MKNEENNTLDKELMLVAMHNIDLELSELTESEAICASLATYVETCMNANVPPSYIMNMVENCINNFI